MRTRALKKDLTTEMIEAVRSRYHLSKIDSVDGPMRKAAVAHFDSLADMAHLRDMLPDTHTSAKTDNWSRSWVSCSGEMVTGSGDANVADVIESAVAKISAGVTAAPGWTMAPAGAYPIVPAAIGGDPFSMRMRTEDRGESNPIRIYIPMVCSAAVKRDTFATIMAMVSAAVLAISEHRAVELLGWFGTGGKCETVRTCSKDNRTLGNASARLATCKISTEWLDSRALSAWTEQSIGRSLWLPLDDAATGKGESFKPWPWGGSPHSSDNIRAMREHLGCTDDDLFIPPLFGDRDVASKLVPALEKAAKSAGLDIDLSDWKAIRETIRKVC